MLASGEKPNFQFGEIDHMNLRLGSFDRGVESRSESAQVSKRLPIVTPNATLLGTT